MSGSSVQFVSETVVTSDLDFNTIVSRGRYYPTRETDIRQRLSEKTQKEANISKTYKDILRAMKAVFNDVGYIDGQNGWKLVRVMTANPERAISKIVQETTMILPVISVAQTVSNNDPDRNRYDSILLNETYWDETKHKAIRVISFAPRAINIIYQVNIWTKYKEDLDQILEQIRLKFNPEISLPTKTSTLVKGFLDNEDDAGAVDVGDKEDRILKKTLTITVRTYIPNPKFIVTSTGALERVLIETEVY